MPRRRQLSGLVLGATLLSACGDGGAQAAEWEKLCAWGKQAEAVPAGSERATLFAAFAERELKDPGIRELFATAAILAPDQRQMHFRNAARKAGKEQCPALDIVFFDPFAVPNPLAP